MIHQLKPVRYIKANFHKTSVANAMGSLGYHWSNPKRRPHSIYAMTSGLTSIELQQLVTYLRYYGSKTKEVKKH